MQSYVGLSSPYNFNGLVRHYFLRRGPHLADLQVNLRRKTSAASRATTSPSACAIGSLPIARRFSATIQVSEVPPGPPVLQTLVAEVYGPDPARRLELAGQVKSVLEQTPASSTSTGTSRRRRRRRHSSSTRRAQVPPPSRRRTCRLPSRWRPKAVPSASCTMRMRARMSRSSCGLPRSAQGSLAAVRELRLGPNLVAVGELTREDDAHGSGQPLSQEPAAGDLRDRRPGRRRREPRLRDPAR